MRPRDLLALTNSDLRDLCDLKADAAIEATAAARAAGNLDRVAHLTREADMWLTIREVHDMAVAS